MATVPRETIQQYDRELRQAQNLAAEYVLRALRTRTSSGTETVASLRNYAIELMVEALNTYGEAAGALASDLFTDIMELEGLSVTGQMRSGVIALAEVERIVRYQATKLVADNVDGFIQQVAEATSFLVRQAANGTMMSQSAFTQYYGGWKWNESQGRAIWSYSSNGIRSNYQIRYARIPQGMETCDFCLMLASRGFVYLSAESAEGWNHTHRGCDCIVVAGLVHKGEDGSWVQDTELEGYDLDSLDEIRSMWSGRERGDTDGRLSDLESVLGRQEW